ncbi:unnamed protein product, partial [Effrenium voratum]
WIKLAGLRDFYPLTMPSYKKPWRAAAKKESGPKRSRPEPSERFPKWILAPYASPKGSPFYLKGDAEAKLLDTTRIAASRNAGNSEVAALRLGIAVSEAAGVGEMAAGLFADEAEGEGSVKQLLEPFIAWMGEPEGAAYVEACRHLNDKNEDATRGPASVQAAVTDWVAGVAALGRDHERDIRKLAQIAARLYLFAADTLEQIAWVENQDVLAKAADKLAENAELAAVGKWLSKPSGDGHLAKAIAAVYSKEVLKGRAGGKKEKPVRMRQSSSPDATASAESSSTSSAKAKKAKKRAKKDKKDKKAKKETKKGDKKDGDKEKKRTEPAKRPEKAKRAGAEAAEKRCAVEDSSQGSPSNAVLSAALIDWTAAECVEVSLELSSPEPSPAKYARAAGAYIDGLLAAEGHGPIPGGPLLLEEWTAALTVAGWREGELCAQAPRRLKRPAALGQHFCHGRLGAPCCYSTAESGARARYQGQTKHCPWCSEELLAKGMATANGQRMFARALAFFWKNDKDIFRAARARLPQRARAHFPLRALGLPPAFHSADAINAATSTPQGRGRCVASLKKRAAADPEAAQEALPAIPEEHRAEIAAKIDTEPRRVRQARARADAAAAEAAAWGLRQRLRAPPAAEEKEVYEERVAEDRVRVRRKFFPARERLVKHSGWRWKNDLPEAVRGLAADGERVKLNFAARLEFQGVRAYNETELEVLRCHVDNLAPQVDAVHGRGLLLRYVAAYAPKMNDNFSEELLAETSGGGYGAALRVLSSYRPSEPEMWLNLFGKKFPQFALGGSMAPIVAPWPGMEPTPGFVERYEVSKWRGPDMTLLEFLRKSRAAESLQEFARACPVFGEKIIAAEMVSPFNDKYYGQWLLLHRPFRRPAYLAAPDYWSDERGIRADLELAAHGDAYIANVLALVSAQRAIVDQYLSGKLTAADEVPEPQFGRPPAGPRSEGEPERPEFNRMQQVLEQATLKRINLLLDFQDARDGETAERLERQIAEENSPLCCMGEPGTGKTFVADYLIRWAVAKGLRVLYALPTAAIAVLMDYDVVVIDEVLQLSAEEFGRLDEMFLAANKQLLLLMMGDDWQLPSVHPVRADEHPQWRFLQVVTLTEVRRCTDPELASKLQALRRSKPMGADGQRLVNRICRRHKAWSGHHEPTAEDIKSVLERTENKTTFVTCSRRGAAVINGFALQVLFENQGTPSLGALPGAYEDNPENYDNRGALRQDRAPLPQRVVLYEGLRVVLTRNRDKPNHFVNGMSATVEAFDERAGCLRALTETGKRLAVYRYTDTDVPVGRSVYYPVRVGYAGTIHKYQGAELAHITVWLDRPFCKAAGYVALSRVARDADYLIGGEVTADDFVPA